MSVSRTAPKLSLKQGTAMLGQVPLPTQVLSEPKATLEVVFALVGEDGKTETLSTTVLKLER